MTTNKEWLYSLEPDELTAWFDAEHVDAMYDNSGENVIHDSISENLGKSQDSEIDSREKLEAEYAEPHKVNMKRYFKPFIEAEQRAIDVDNDSREKLEDDVVHECARPGFGPEFGEIMAWLDRQAAIDRKEFQSILEEIQTCMRNGSR